MNMYVVNLLGATYEVRAGSASGAKRALAAKLRKRPGIRRMGPSAALQRAMSVRRA